MSIAFVGAADLGNNGGTTTNHTASYSCGSGSNRMLVVAFAGDQIPTNDDITSVTYASVGMTLAVKFTFNAGAGTRYLYIYYLINPASGANNVSISCGTAHYLIAVAADYTGVNATGQPDATETTAVPLSSPASTVTDIITTVADKSWAVLVDHDSGTVTAAPTAGAGLTRRVFGAAFNFPVLFDSAADITPAGNYNMTTNSASSGFIEHAAASFAPAATVSSAGGMGALIVA